ncbi:hypothetical protein WDD9_004744 [Paenibacillus melissococcoides]|nr:hypothetical protein [Paenibacillus melissococcoides]CAH8716974.1 hypothetical protein WDD9_004744 [Paenibacillus melissococcoides]
MLEQAKAKLRAEMDGTKDNDYVQFVGQYLLGPYRGAPWRCGEGHGQG